MGYAIAIMECVIANGGDTTQNGNTCQIVVVIEHIITSRGNTVSNHHGPELRTVRIPGRIGAGRIVRHGSAAIDSQYAVVGQCPLRAFTAVSFGHDSCPKQHDRSFCRFRSFGGGFYGSFCSSFGSSFRSGFSSGFTGRCRSSRFRGRDVTGFAAGEAIVAVDVLGDFQHTADQVAVRVPAGIAVGVEDNDFLGTDLCLYGFIAALAVGMILVGHQLTGQRLTRGKAGVRMLMGLHFR